MAEPENAERLVEVLKEIRDELRAVRIELGAGGARMPSGIRTKLVNRGGHGRASTLAAAGVVGLALVIGLAVRERPAPQPATVAVAPQISAPPAAKSETPSSIPGTPTLPSAASPAQAPVAAHVAAPLAKSPVAVPALATKQVQRFPAGAPAPTALAAVPAVAKKRLTSDVAARPPVEATSDDDETMAFPQSPKRVRVHRLSYGPVGSEPAKL